MQIKSKESFFELLILTMSSKGIDIETFTFPDDFISFTSNSKYDDLFYFFEQEKDFIFEKELSDYMNKGLIEVRKRNNGSLTIALKKAYVINQLLNHFDADILNKMTLLLEEINTSKKLLIDELYSNTKAVFNKGNPNRVYTIRDDMLIVTDGIVIKKDYLATGSYLVEQANFVCLHRFFEGKMEEVNVFYRFAYEQYLYNILRKIILFIKRTQNYEEKIDESSMNSLRQFEELQVVKGYRYKNFKL